MTTAVSENSAARSTRRKSVVLPLPRNPVSSVTGTVSSTGALSASNRFPICGPMVSCGARCGKRRDQRQTYPRDIAGPGRNVLHSSDCASIMPAITALQCAVAILGRRAHGMALGATTGSADAPDDILLASTAVSKRFGGVRAGGDGSISVRRGGITSIIGPNGAGKTSRLNMISGFSPPDGGPITFAGVGTTVKRPG